MKMHGQGDIVGVIPFVVLGGMFAWLIVRLLREAWLRANSRNWPSATATIVDAKSFSQRTKSGELWYVCATYSFTTSSGDYYGSEAFFDSTSAEADEFARCLAGTTAEVRYQPSAPDVSLLELADGRAGRRSLV